MSGTGRWRVSLGELMVFVALAAAFLAPELSVGRFHRPWHFLANDAVNVATIGLLYFHRRLSGWIWLMLAPWYVRPVIGLARVMDLPRWPGLDELLLLWTDFLGSVFFLVGLGMFFRDVRRRLAAAGRPRPVADGGVLPSDVSWGP